MKHGYQPANDNSLDLTNPPDDFTAIQPDLAVLIRQLPEGYELIHDHDGLWYCCRYVKGGDFSAGYKSAEEALRARR